MKVFIVASSLGAGGRERQIIELAKGLSAHKIEFKLVSFSSDISVEGILDFDKRILIFDKSKGLWFAIYQYIMQLTSEKPDIVHCWDGMATSITIIAKLFYSFKIIDGSIRGAFPFFKRKLLMFVTKWFTFKIVANSLAGLASINQSLTSKYAVIYNGIDFFRFANGKDHNGLLRGGEYEKMLKVGMVANIRDGKDYTTFMEVAKIILKTRKDVLFISVGAGEYEHLTTQISEEVTGNVLFLCKQKNVERIIENFDVGLLLTDTDYAAEGLSNSIMEYMALGVPVIATEAGGNPEIVADGDSGFLVPSKSSTVITEKLLYLLDNREIRKKMGIAGKLIIEEKFNLQKMVNSYVNLYNEAC